MKRKRFNAGTTRDAKVFKNPNVPPVPVKHKRYGFIRAVRY